MCQLTRNSAITLCFTTSNALLRTNGASGNHTVPSGPPKFADANLVTWRCRTSRGNLKPSTRRFVRSICHCYSRHQLSFPSNYAIDLPCGVSRILCTQQQDNHVIARGSNLSLGYCTFPFPGHVTKIQ